MEDIQGLELGVWAVPLRHCRHSHAAPLVDRLQDRLRDRDRLYAVLAVRQPDRMSIFLRDCRKSVLYSSKAVVRLFAKLHTLTSHAVRQHTQPMTG